MQNRSLEQDVGPHGDENQMHYLRDPGQDAQEAQRLFEDYITTRELEGRAAHLRGDEKAALEAIADISHAKADFHSPAHNEGGKLAMYDPDWSVLDAWGHGHSPLDILGRERTRDITPDIERRIAIETNKAADSILGPRRSKPIPIGKRNLIRR